MEAGAPGRTGTSKSFHSRLRDSEFLEGVEFESVADAQAKGGWFRREYNTIRPHSSIGYKTPREFSEECDRKKLMKNVISCDVEDTGIR